MKHKMKIETNGTLAHVYIDGVGVPGLRAYSVTHSAHNFPSVELEFVGDVEIDADEVEVKTNDECVRSCGNCSHLIFCNCPSLHWWCNKNKDCPCNGDGTPDY